jgi:hypothetical protein
MMSFIVEEEARRTKSLEHAGYDLCDGAKQEDYCSAVDTNQAEEDNKAKLEYEGDDAE